MTRNDPAGHVSLLLAGIFTAAALCLGMQDAIAQVTPDKITGSFDASLFERAEHAEGAKYAILPDGSYDHSQGKGYKSDPRKDYPVTTMFVVNAGHLEDVPSSVITVPTKLTPPILNQFQVGTCFEAAYASLVDSAICRTSGLDCSKTDDSHRVSLMDPVINRQSLAWPDSSGFSLNFVAARTAGRRLASNACLPYDRYFAWPSGSLLPLATQYGQTLLSRLKGNTCPECIARIRSLLLTATGVDVSAETINSALAKQENSIRKRGDLDLTGWTPREWLEFAWYNIYPSLIEPAKKDCGAQSIQLPDVVVANFITYDVDDFFLKLSILLSKGYPVSTTMSVQILGEPDGIGHSIDVYGIKTACSRSACTRFVKLHNSWGNEWQASTENGWVNGLLFFSAMPEVTSAHREVYDMTRDPRATAGAEATPMAKFAKIHQDRDGAAQITALVTQADYESITNTFAAADAIRMAVHENFKEATLSADRYLNYKESAYSSLLKYYDSVYGLPPWRALDRNLREKKSVGDTLDLQKLAKTDTPGSLLPGVSESNQHFFDELIAKLHDKSLAAYSAALIGNDLYVVQTSTGYIVTVYRDFMNVYRGNLHETLLHPTYSEPNEDSVLTYKEEGNVPPTELLRKDDFGAETPHTLPSAKTIRVQEAWSSIRAGLLGKKPPPLVLSAIEEDVGLPTARNVSFAAVGGTFNDAVQERFAKYMHAALPDTSREIIVYCHGQSCWLSYNVGLRLKHLGYSNIRWLRDGIQGWTQYHLPIAQVDMAE